jgi:hypothetical protein
MAKNGLVENYFREVGEKAIQRCLGHSRRNRGNHCFFPL